LDAGYSDPHIPFSVLDDPPSSVDSSPFSLFDKPRLPSYRLIGSEYRIWKSEGTFGYYATLNAIAILLVCTDDPVEVFFNPSKHVDRHARGRSVCSRRYYFVSSNSGSNGVRVERCHAGFRD
jgi:hypothetical protein